MIKAFVFEITTLKIMDEEIVKGIEIVNGRVFVNEKETVNPELIGYALLDAAENSDTIICSYKEIKDLVSKAIVAAFSVTETIDEAMQSFKKVG